jgi:RHS repeat-associated protein
VILFVGFAPPSVASAQVTIQCVSGCLGTVSVSPDGADLAVNANTTLNLASFGIAYQSGTTSSRTFALTCTSTGGVTCGTVTPSSITLQPNNDGGATVRFNVSGTGGLLRLRARYGTGSIEDFGSYNIKVRGPTSVTLRNYNPDNQDRSLCLTSGAGEAAAAVCGDLIVSHGTPGYTTLGRERSLALVYNSHTAYPRPIVTAAVTQPAGVATPNAIYTELEVAGAIRASATYSPWSSGITKQVGLGFDAAGWGTGVWPFTLRVQSQYSNVVSTSTVTGKLLIVNRYDSEFGAGVWLAGVERILYQPDGSMLWFGGDGSAKVYGAAGTNQWVAPAGAFRDTLVYSPADTIYTRTLRHGVKVTFNPGGFHTRTINRTGQQTHFNWVSYRLMSVTVPPTGASGTTYTLAYDGAGKLDRITDPAGRVLDVAVTGGVLDTIVDPDNRRTTFGYNGDRKMTSRMDRRGFTTVYEYAKSHRLTKVTVPAGRQLSDPAVAVTQLTAWDEQGLAFGAGTQIAVDTAKAYTRILGPRFSPTVSDTAAFWVDRWGAPTKIVNAIGATTTLLRGNVSYPALVTSVKFPNGRHVTMDYEPSRGNLALVRDINSLGSVGAGAMPTKVTAYTYGDGNAPDSPTIVADSINGGAYRSLYTYTTDGLTLTATDRRGHTTRFATRTSGPLRGVVDTVIEQQVETWSVGNTDEVADAPADQVVVFSYDNNGNVRQSKSPSGVITSFQRDNKGRVTDTYDPLGFHTRMLYDQLNRITRTTRFTLKTAHPAGTLQQSCDSLQVLCTDFTQAPGAALGDSLPTIFHNGYATLDSITDPRGNTRRFAYDARGLLMEERDEIWNLPRLRHFDLSGAPTRSLGRQFPSDPDVPSPQDTVHVQYDAMGRRTKVFMSCSWYNSTSCVGGVGEVPSDTTRYTYDNMNNVLTATNANGTITRTYYGDGSLRTQKVSLPGGIDSAAYTYDSTGARTRVSRTSAGKTDVTTYVYHPTTGDLQSLTVTWGDPLNVARTFTFAWDALGRRRQITYPTGIVAKFRYDKQGTLRRLVSSNPASVAGVADRFDFTYRVDSLDVSGRALFEHTTCAAGTDAGQPGSACSAASPQNLKLSRRYDRLGMLVWQKSSDELLPQEFAYDKAGNLIYRKRNSDVHYFRIANLGNQLLADSMPGDNASQIVNFRYTADGARRREYFNSAPGGSDTKLFYYDGMGRPSGVRDLAHDVANRVNCVKYDPDGQLALPCDDHPSWLAFDGSNVASTIATNRWVFVSGPSVDDPLIGLYRDPSAAVKEFYWVTDGSGRQLAVGLPDGSLSGPDRTNYFFNGGKFAGGTDNATTFDASRFEAATIAPKLSYFRNRIYDQETGRWTQEDPIGHAGGLNLYQFNGNNPVKYTDPFGLCGRERGNCLQGEDAYKADPVDKFVGLTGPTGSGGVGIGLPLVTSLAGLLKPQVAIDVHTGPVDVSADGEDVTVSGSAATGTLGVTVSATWGQTGSGIFGGAVGTMFGQGIIYGFSANQRGGAYSFTASGGVGYNIPGGLGSVAGRIVRFFSGSVTQTVGE